MQQRILFFGGYGSTLADMRSVRLDIKKQKPEVDICAWRYPVGAGAGLKDALNGFGNDNFDQVVALVNGSPETQHIIVGHSSGCAIANAVASGLLDKNLRPFNWRLVVLDGFRPDDALLPYSTCWSAKCGEIHSRNWDALCSVKGFQVYEAVDCTEEWPLHFSLVNAAASNKVVTSITYGYNDFKANLCWL
jgi:pimeloyl-ACP methyl ester carboxylesterase